ncbi:histidine phosphatase family protein [Thiomicrorhabdus sp. ZW0627]|uniref:SixA phosphatase family protein n=1 Tax=Thiomicrorhabdus sp. ZW0627 TaxID=3039774 RepID=UPI0024369DF8|nr:histidine phosphatase family protein [Thiomicrorhabdus sp. ZW0627]MDG6773860.1 histidine phosphatase family protein [Thiomicrorhabdus sp. ZW0627]
MSNRLRELILLRHAKSDWKDENLEDIDRPLCNKGKKSAAKVGKWLQQQNIIPDLILTSPATRAQQTLKRICSECGSETQTLDTLYLADLNTLINILADAPDVDRLMIIGHNPGLERLFNFLNSAAEESETHLFPTASLAHFILPDNWQSLSRGDGKLLQFIRPKDIQLTE